MTPSMSARQQVPMTPSAGVRQHVSTIPPAWAGQPVPATPSIYPRQQKAVTPGWELLDLHEHSMAADVTAEAPKTPPVDQRPTSPLPADCAGQDPYVHVNLLLAQCLVSTGIYVPT